MQKSVTLRTFKALLLCVLLLPAADTSAQPVIRKIAAGTGFYISHDGYLLTANHVVSHCSDDISAHNEQMVLKVQLLATNQDSDLALLKIIPDLTIDHIATMRSERQPIQVGEKIVVAGYPTQTTDLNREFVAFSTNDARITNAQGPGGKKNWIQFSYSARPGFSGGPVLDSYGNIVGVTSGGTCTSRECYDKFKGALNALKAAQNPDEMRIADEAVAANSDTNIAASRFAIRTFLAQNNVAMEERESVMLPSEQRLGEIAESIVNLRCTQNDEDFKNSSKVLKIR